MMVCVRWCLERQFGASSKIQLPRFDALSMAISEALHTHTQTPTAAQVQVTFPFHPSAQSSDLELGCVGGTSLIPLPLQL